MVAKVAFSRASDLSSITKHYDKLEAKIRKIGEEKKIQTFDSFRTSGANVLSDTTRHISQSCRILVIAGNGVLGNVSRE